MNYQNPIYRLIFVIGMMINLQIQNTIAQGDALTLTHNCETGCIDLQINGGFSPYDVEWQRLVGGQWTSLTGWPKIDLNGNNGVEDLCAETNVSELTQFKVIVSDALCGTAEATIFVESCCDISINGEVTHANNSDCDNGSINIQGSSNYSYVWTYNDGSGPVVFSSSQNIEQIRGNTTYCVSVTAVGCGNTVTECFEVYCCPSLPGETITHYCDESNQGSISLDLSSGYNYYVSWFDQNGNQVSGSDSGAENLLPGIYLATFESQNCIFTKTFEILDYSISTTLVSLDNPTCDQSNTDGMISINVNSNSGLNYQVTWYNSNNGYPTGNAIGNGTTLSNIGAGEYIAIIVNGQCTVMSSEYKLVCCYVVVDEQAKPTMPFPAFTNVQVNWESSAGACDGSISYGTNIPNYISKKITIKKMPEGTPITKTSNLCTGTYCITLDNGCDEYTECFTIGSCSSVSINVNGTVTNTCQGYSVGAVSVSPSGGNSPYKYKWSNGKTSSSINSLAQGQYCVTATDQNGCIGTACFTVGLNTIVVTRNGCTFTERCNGNVVYTYGIGSYSVTNPSDCRYRDSYCNDGYYLGSTYVGTDFDIISNCTVYERCRTTGSIYRVHNGVNRSRTLRGFDSRSNCWWCNNVTFCQFPSLGDWINPNSVSFSPIGDGYNYSTQEGGCTLQDGTKGCAHRVYCNYQVIGSWCQPGVCISTERPCVGGILGLKYEVLTESLKNKEGYLETIYKYKLLSFDTTAAVNFIKNDLVELENYLAGNNEYFKGEPISDNKNFKLGTHQDLFSIYPNPAFQEFTLQFDSRMYQETMTLELFDVTGKVVNSILIENNQIGITIIPIDHLSDGLYLLRLKNKIDNQIIFSDKIIKNSK